VADNGNKADATPPAPTDPVTKALLEAKAQAEARKAIAEADLGAAKALLPTLPTEFPGSKVDASGAGGSFASVNCYRAVLNIAELIADEICPDGARTIWISPTGASRSPTELHAEVVRALDLGTVRVDHAVALLNAAASAPSPGSGASPTVDTAALPALAIAGLSSLLPLVFSAFSSTNTIKGGATDLDDAAVLNLVVRALMTRGCTVLQPDASTATNSELTDKVEAHETQILGLQTAMDAAASRARRAHADADALRDELEVLKELVVEYVKKNEPPDITAQMARIQDLAALIAANERLESAAQAAVTEANATREALQLVLSALRTPDVTGVTPLALASFGALLADASEVARLEVGDVSAGTESQYHDRKMLRDLAIHTGSVAVSFRLTDATGTLLATNVYVNTASSKVDLETGAIDWIT
jgi:hypothetical protein